MRKIPVLKTIADAYGFALGNFITVVGLVWLPLLLLLSMQYYVTQRVLGGYLAAQAEGNLYELHRATVLRYGSVLVALVFQAILLTPVMRQALGLRQGRAIVSFEFSVSMLRVLGSSLLLAVAIVAIEYVLFIPVVALVVGLFVAAKSAVSIQGVPAMVVAAWASGGAVVLAACALVFITVRLSFFVTAVAVAERKIDLIRAWRLTAWNFWRIFIVLLATLMPFAILFLAVLWAALGFPLLHLPPPALTASWKGAPTKALIWMIGALTQKLPYFYGVTFVLAPLAVGLSTGAVASAYRSLVPPTETGGAAEKPAPEAIPA